MTSASSLPGHRPRSPPSPDPMDWARYRRRLDYLNGPQSVAGFRKMQQDLGRPRHDLAVVTADGPGNLVTAACPSPNRGHRHDDRDDDDDDGHVDAAVAAKRRRVEQTTQTRSPAPSNEDPDEYQYQNQNQTSFQHQNQNQTSFQNQTSYQNQTSFQTQTQHPNLLMPSSSQALAYQPLTPAASPAMALMAAPSNAPSSPSLRPATPLQGPGLLWLPDECIRAVLDWTNSRFESGVWNGANGWGVEAGPHMSVWTNHAALAKEVVQSGDMAGFRMVQICFAQYAAIVRAEEPAEMLAKTLVVAFYMTQAGPEVGDAFVRYSASLLPLTLGERHPLSRIWRAIGAHGLDGIRPYLARILGAQFDLVRHYSPPRDKGVAVAELEYTRNLHRLRAISGAAARAKIGAIVDRMSADIRYWTLDYVLWAKLELATVYVDDGNLTEALELLEHIGQKLAAAAEPYDIWTLSVYHSLRAQTMDGLGLPDEALAAYQARFDVCLREVGPDSRHTVRALGALARYHRQMGHLDEAARLGLDFDRGWRAICDGAAQTPVE